MKKYVVRQGDTMWSISEATGVKPNLLLAANPQVKNPNQLRPGSIIVIPELTKHPVSAKPGIQETPQPETVMAPKPVTAAPQGATVPDASAASAQELQAQVTKPAAPGMPTSGSTHMPPFFGFVWPHVVQPGETWKSIETKYNVSKMHIEQLNPGLANRPLQPGVVVYVPGMIPQAQFTHMAGMPGHQGYPAGHGHQQAYTGYPTGQSAPQTAASTGLEGGAQPNEPGQLGGYKTYPGAGATYPSAPGTTATQATPSPSTSMGGFPEMGPHEHYPYRQPDGSFYGQPGHWDNGTWAAEWEDESWRTEEEYKTRNEGFEWPKSGSSSISVFLGESSPQTL